MLHLFQTVKRRMSILLALAIIVGGLFGNFSHTLQAAPGNNNVVISQLYGGGGNSGAQYKNDFIELYNPTGEAISLEGWSLQYASPTGSWPVTGQNVHVLGGNIGPGKYFLTQQAAGSGGSVNLPEADDVGTLAMGATNGKVRLIDQQGNVVDLVGYGTATESEFAPAPAISNTTALIRKALHSTDRGLDTDNNSSDFIVGAPDPRNSAYGDVVGDVIAQPGSGPVESGTEVTLTTETAEAIIHYRLNVSEEFQIYSGPIAITAETVVEAYAAKDGLETSPVVTFHYTISGLSTIAEARVMEDGSSVIIEGIVTYKEFSGGKFNLYVQDETGGIVVRGSGLSAEIGDKIKASGTTLQYFGLAQLDTEASNVTVTAANAGVPLPARISSADLTAETGESYEAQFVKVENVTAGTSNPFNEFTVTDEQGSFIIKSTHLITGKHYELIYGVVTYAFGNYMLVPRSASDIHEKALSVYADPSPDSFVQAGTFVELVTPADDGVIYYTVDGSEPAQETAAPYTAPISIAENTVIKAIVVLDDAVSEVYTFHFTVQQTYAGLKINEIQSAAHVSPYNGHKVTGVEGIVTMKRSDGKWFLQSAPGDMDDSDATSEAVLIEPKIYANVAVGDHVTVAGTVQEVKEEGYADAKDLTTTQIAVTAVTVNSSGNPLPAPVVIGVDRIQPTSVIDNDGMTVFDPVEDALDFYESLEGMLVQLNDARITGPYHFEIPVILDEQPEDAVFTPAGGIMLTERSLNPQRILIKKEPAQKVKTGDRFAGPIIGVMSYDYSNYKVIPESLPAVIPGSLTRETTALEYDESKLTVASYNIENFWDNPSSKEIMRKNNIAKSIVTNLKSPDIIALIEVQDNNGTVNDGTTDASQSYEALIEAIKASGGPEYKFTDIAPVNNTDGGAPGGNIRVGYLYNDSRVTLVNKEKGGPTTAVSYGEGGLSHNPGRIDPTNEAFESSRKPLAAEFEFRGERVIVIANHFNSKRGDEAPFGSVQPLPETLGSEVQRHKIAKVVNDFVRSILDREPEANVIVLGDLNDFQFSRTLEITKGSELINLIDTMPENERYSYIYQGNSQTLDHILVDKGLAPHSEIDIVHINADFDEVHGRVSDHDPLIVQVDLAAKKMQESFALTLMHLNDTHAHLDNVAKRVTAINRVREETDNSILLDAGDVFSGTLYYNKYLGLADLEFMNYIGYDAMVFGNHEFDAGPAVLADFVKDATFPFVSSNIDFSEEPALSGFVAEQNIGKPAEGGKIYQAIILDVGGEQVGVFGLTTEDTKFLSSPGENIRFENYLDKARETVKMLQDEGINKIVALTHLGYAFDVILAQEVPGIDVIVGGHSHTYVASPVVFNEESEPTLIVQGEDYSKYLGRLDLQFDNEGVLTSWDGKLLDLSQYAEDAEAAEMLVKYKEGVEEIKRAVVGNTNIFLDGERSSIRSKETNLGNLIADGMREKVRSLIAGGPEVKGYVAIQNGGGIRASIAEGDITLGDLLTVMPFGNNLTALKMSGEEIIEALENGVSGVESGQGRFPHVSGMRFYYDSTKQAEALDSDGQVLQAGERIVKVEIKNDDGTYSAIDPNGYYIVATNSFMAGGGDFYRSMKAAKEDGRHYELNIVDYEVFLEYLNQIGAINLGTEGRITDLQGGPLPDDGNGQPGGKDKDKEKKKEKMKDKGKKIKTTEK